MENNRHEIEIERPGNIRDAYVLQLLPDHLIGKLGEPVGKDYDLKYSKRTLQYEHGTVEYWPYKTRAIITIDDNNS